jgi:hypothetical protein
VGIQRTGFNVFESLNMTQRVILEEIISNFILMNIIVKCGM